MATNPCALYSGGPSAVSDVEDRALRLFWLIARKVGWIQRGERRDVLRASDGIIIKIAKEMVWRVAMILATLTLFRWGFLVV
jgi:hypothetical protein